MRPREPKAWPCGAGGAGPRSTFPMGPTSGGSRNQNSATLFYAPVVRAISPPAQPPPTTPHTHTQHRRALSYHPDPRRGGISQATARPSKPTPRVLIQTPHVTSLNRSGEPPVVAAIFAPRFQAGAPPALSSWRLSGSLRRPCSIPATSPSVDTTRRNISRAAIYNPMHL